ncbi:hypothetical protein B0H11DRAFT_2293682 [Mycena galericulata]|nr:hypothetical protein B0H11DRAFT_2293682 [Mycena galericulata]
MALLACGGPRAHRLDGGRDTLMGSVAYLCYEYKVLPPGTLLLAPLCICATPLVSLYARCLPFASRHHRPILGLCLVALGPVPWLPPIVLPAVACCPLAAALLACSIRALLPSSHLPPYLLVLLASPLRPARCSGAPARCPDAPARCPAAPPHPTRGACVLAASCPLPPPDAGHSRQLPAVPARYPTLPLAAPPPPPQPTHGAYVPAAPRPLPPPNDRHSRQLPRRSRLLPDAPTRCPAAPAPAYSCCLRPRCAPPAVPARHPTLLPAAPPFLPVSPLPTPRRPSTPDAHRPMPAPRPLLPPPFVLGVLSHFLLAMPPPFWLLPLLAPV